MLSMCACVVELSGSLKAGFVTERGGAGSCRGFSVLALLSFIGSLKGGFVTLKGAEPALVEPFVCSRVEL